MKNKLRIFCLAAIAVLALGTIISYVYTNVKMSGIIKGVDVKAGDTMHMSQSGDLPDENIHSEDSEEMQPVKQERAGCYAITEETSAAVIDYARGEFPGILAEHLAANGVDVEDRQYSLGHPIKLSEIGEGVFIYHFPVMLDGNIFAILTVYEEKGTYSSQLEESLLARKLNELKEKTYAANPLAFLASNAGFFAALDDNVWPLTPDSDVSEIDASSLPDGNPQGKVIDLTEMLSFVDGKDIVRIGGADEKNRTGNGGKQDGKKTAVNEIKNLIPKDAAKEKKQYKFLKNSLFLDYDNMGVKKIITKRKGDGSFDAEDLGTWLKKQDVYDISVVEDNGEHKKLYYESVPENQEREEFSFAEDREVLHFGWLVYEGDVITSTSTCMEEVIMVEPDGSFYTDYTLN